MNSQLKALLIRNYLRKTAVSANIPNIQEHFTVIDDTACYKMIEDYIQFFNKEIVKIKERIEETSFSTMIDLDIFGHYKA